MNLHFLNSFLKLLFIAAILSYIFFLNKGLCLHSLSVYVKKTFFLGKLASSFTTALSLLQEEVSKDIYRTLCIRLLKTLSGEV